MPSRALRPCAWPGCIAVQVSAYCDEHERKRARSAGAHVAEHQRLYDRRWQRIRAAQLAAYPWCARCLSEGIHTLATDVHHVERHLGDTAMFYGSPLQSLCHVCHSAVTASEIGLNSPPVKKVFKGYV